MGVRENMQAIHRQGSQDFQKNRSAWLALTGQSPASPQAAPAPQPEFQGTPYAALGLPAPGVGGLRAQDEMALEKQAMTDAQLADLQAAVGGGTDPATGAGSAGGGYMGGSAFNPTARPVDRSRWEDAVDALDAKGIEALNAQKKGIKDAEGRTKDLRGQEMYTDLSPLMALTDSWFGGSLQKGYAAPETVVQRDQRVEALEQAVQKQRGALTDDEVGLLRTRLGAEDSRLSAAERAEESRQRREFEAWNANETRAARIEAAKDRADSKASQHEMQDTFKFMGLKPVEQVRGASIMVDALNAYEKAVRDFGVNPNTEQTAQLQSLYTNMTTKFKEAEALGALSGPDMDLVRGNIAAAGGWDAYLRSFLPGGRNRESILAQAQVIRDNAKKSVDYNLGTLDTAFGQKKHLQPLIAKTRGEFERAYHGNSVDAQAGVAPPEVGTVKKGYRFKGGNPNDPAAWEVAK